MIAYLAAPYSHPEPTVREERFQAACRATAALMRSGVIVLSPIVHSHPLVAYGLPTHWQYWQRCDREYLARCNELIVLKLDGWKTSVGVQAEIRLARSIGIPVRYLAPENATLGHPLARVAKEAGP